MNANFGLERDLGPSKIIKVNEPVVLPRRAAEDLAEGRVREAMQYRRFSIF